MTPATEPPTTAAPTTLASKTEAPTTTAPTTAASTAAPTTAPPTTAAPTTAASTTAAPTTAAPTTAAPTTAPPTTAAPTTEASTTAAPTTAAPTTAPPTTAAPTTEASTTAAPTKAALTTTTFKNGDCYQDCSPRLLPKLEKNYKMTHEICKSICFKKNNYAFAGVEFGHECWCGNNEPPATKLRPLSECNISCPGDSAEKCGGGCRINIFKNSGNFIRLLASNMQVLDSRYLRIGLLSPLTETSV